MNEPRHISEVLADAGGDLTRIHPRALDVYADGYATGYAHGRVTGHAEGYAHRADDEATEWVPVRDHLTAYVRSMYGLAERRTAAEANRPARRTGAEIIAAAHASWGIPYRVGGGRHVA